VKTLRASSRCTKATIALQNSLSRNRHQQLKPHLNREKLPQQLEKSHGPHERQQRKPERWRNCVGRPRPAPDGKSFRTVGQQFGVYDQQLFLNEKRKRTESNGPNPVFDPGF
jgi:hypothetical protein